MTISVVLVDKQQIGILAYGEYIWLSVEEAERLITELRNALNAAKEKLRREK